MAQDALHRSTAAPRPAQSWYDRNRSSIIRHGVINLFNVIIILPLIWVLLGLGGVSCFLTWRKLTP